MFLKCCPQESKFYRVSSEFWPSTSHGPLGRLELFFTDEICPCIRNVPKGLVSQGYTMVNVWAGWHPLYLNELSSSSTFQSPTCTANRHQSKQMQTIAIRKLTLEKPKWGELGLDEALRILKKHLTDHLLLIHYCLTAILYPISYCQGYQNGGIWYRWQYGG